MSPSSETVMAVYDEWEAANAKVAGLSLDALTHTELLQLAYRREVVVRTQPTVDHRIINRLAAEADPKALGGTSLADVLAAKLGISKVEGCRRIKQAELLGPRRAITGEPLAPKLANTAAQARGQIGREHGSPRVWDRRSCGRPPIGWHCCSTRTASHPMRPSEHGAAT